MASRAICVIVLGVVPVDPPTPALSNVTTRRSSRQRVDQRGIPVVEVPAEVLEKHERRRPVADLAIRVVDPVRGADHAVGSRQVVAGGR